jgi:hypothetical protein
MIFGKNEPKGIADPKTNGNNTRQVSASSSNPPSPPMPGRTTAAPVAAAAPPSRSTAAPTAAAPTPAAANPERQAATLRYIDRPDTTETFADSITGLFFDGQTLRIEFAVTRIDELKPNTPVTGRRYPACRVVLPPTAAIDLINRMQQIAAALTQAGIAKQTPRAGEAPKID